MSQHFKDTPKTDRESITEVLSTLAKITSRSPQQIKPYLDELLSRLSQDSSPYARHFFNTATDDEWIASFSQWSQSHKSRNLPVLSDEAMSRDRIYDERG